MDCLGSLCPKKDCNLVIPFSIFTKYLEEKDLGAYNKFHCRSFTDDNINIKWCPAAGCDYVIEKLEGGNKQIFCKCGNVFCYSCNQEAHMPVDCSMREEWLKKNKSETPNVSWIMLNTKPCPKCHKPIEKNQGCNHMTCINGCSYQFCWICLGDWIQHQGNYNCNKYLTEKGNRTADLNQQNIKNELEKYIFYFERYENHCKSQKMAEKIAPNIGQIIIDLHCDGKYPIEEVEFLREALNTVVNCRRVLKWTYAYGFYIKNSKEQNLLEFSQESLEQNCEKLHEMIETPLEKYLNFDSTNKSKFYSFKTDLTNYSNTTMKFCNNLLEAIETGLTKTKRF